MKGYVVLGTLIFCLLSCTYSDIYPEPDSTPPAREIYFDWDGTKTGETNFEYDNQLRVIRESYHPVNDEVQTSDITYEYDAAGHLLKKTHGTYVLENTYKNGLVEYTTEYYTDSEFGGRTYFYYTGTRLDSSVWLSLPELERQPYTRAIVYEYDDQQRLIRKNSEFYEYDENGKVTSTCWYNAPKSCYTNEYNHYGQLLKTFLVSDTPSETYLLNEYVYKNGRLDEKKIYSWFYVTPPAPNIFVTKYEY